MFHRPPWDSHYRLMFSGSGCRPSRHPPLIYKYHQTCVGENVMSSGITWPSRPLHEASTTLCLHGSCTPGRGVSFPRGTKKDLYFFRRHIPGTGTGREYSLLVCLHFTGVFLLAARDRLSSPLHRPIWRTTSEIIPPLSGAQQTHPSPVWGGSTSHMSSSCI